MPAYQINNNKNLQKEIRLVNEAQVLNHSQGFVSCPLLMYVYCGNNTMFNPLELMIRSNICLFHSPPDMIKRRNLRTRNIKVLVLDEADEMLNKGND